MNIENDNYKIGNIEVAKPTKNKDGWYGIQQQSFTIDKGQFLISEFNKDFPNFSVDSYEQLQDIVSRSSALKTWYAAASLKYVDNVQLPVAFKDVVEPDEYQTYFNDLQQIKKTYSQMSAEIEKESATFKKKVSAIQANSMKEVDKISSKNKYYPIFIMTKEDLPLTLQFEVNSYSPKVDDVVKERSTYASELLINYQRSLIELVKENPDIDIVQVIEDNRLK